MHVVCKNEWGVARKGCVASLKSTTQPAAAIFFCLDWS